MSDEVKKVLMEPFKAPFKQEELGEIQFECFCHSFACIRNQPGGEVVWQSEVSYCGVPRAEQARHGKPFLNKDRTPYCAYCGLKRCAKCYQFIGGEI